MIYVRDIIEKFDGKLICGDINMLLDNFSHDTRTINKDDIYVGIKGEAFDGNKFYEDAFDKGAKCCILDNESLINKDKYQDKTIILVEDSLKCIQKLAKYKRSLYNIPVIGITGSVGKTSTKDMISSVLETKYKVLKTIGNNNNHIGLPFTILRLKDEEIMVLEMGMNNFKEISFLTNIAKPTIGVITNIGTAHIGNLGSRENIMKAKLEIIEGLNGPLIINNDNDMLNKNLEYIKSLNPTITIGIENNSDYMAKKIDKSLTKFEIEDNSMECNIGNEAFIYNSLMAYVIGKLCNVDVENIKKGIKSFKLTSGRLEYKTIKENITLIDDTYNASLDSIKSSLQILTKTSGKRKIAVIGDVLELGEFSKELHISIAKELLNSNLDYIITIGKETLNTNNYLKENNYNNLLHFNFEFESYEKIDQLLNDGDTILFKGSHGMKLNNIVTYLTNKYNK